MFDIRYNPFLRTPLGISIFVGVVVMLYLFLMSFSVYLPTILILSVAVGFIVYQSQTTCLAQPQLSRQQQIPVTRS
jgi:hypothetical protein